MLTSSRPPHSWHRSRSCPKRSGRYQNYSTINFHNTYWKPDILSRRTSNLHHLASTFLLRGKPIRERHVLRENRMNLRGESNLYREYEAKRTERKTRKNVCRATKLMFKLHALEFRAITAILLPLLTMFLRKGSFPYE